jgi:hypothetical protein
MPPQLVTPSPSAHPPGLGLPGLPRAEAGGMTRLPPQPDDNLDQAAASILESEVPARSTVRAAPRRIARWRARHGAAQRCRLIPIWPHSATGTSDSTSDHIRPPTPGLRIRPRTRVAGRPLMGSGGVLCRLSGAQVRELETGRARMQYRPGVVQGFPASTGLGLVFFL